MNLTLMNYLTWTGDAYHVIYDSLEWTCTGIENIIWKIFGISLITIFNNIKLTDLIDHPNF